MVIMDIIKRLSYQKVKINTYFYRSQNNLEIDLILERGLNIIPIEIKFAKTVSKELASNLKLFKNEYPFEKGYLASLNETNLPFYENIYSINFKNIPLNVE